MSNTAMYTQMTRLIILIGPIITDQVCINFVKFALDMFASVNIKAKTNNQTKLSRISYL